MVNIINMKDDIINVTFYLNIILLIIGIFLTSKAYFITAIIINLIFNGTYLVILKFSSRFNTQIKLFGDMENLLGFFYGMGRK